MTEYTDAPVNAAVDESDVVYAGMWTNNDDRSQAALVNPSRVDNDLTKHFSQEMLDHIESML